MPKSPTQPQRTTLGSTAVVKPIGATLLAFVFSLLSACAGESSAAVASERAARDSAAMTLSPQDVATAEMQEIGSAISVSGPLQPKEIVTLRAQVDGTIAELRVDRGSSVRKGQRLASINADGVMSRAAGARASVASANASLAVAKKQLDAAVRLFAAGAISEVDKQSAEAAYESARAQVAAAVAQLAGANEQAGYTALVSPLDGVVSDRPRQSGENVRVGDEIISVVNSSVLQLAGQISVGEAARVRIGQPVEFTLDAIAGDAFRGRVARMDPVADAGTRQVGVYVELNNPKGRIVGGQFARGRILLGNTRAIVVPSTAIRNLSTDGTTGFVFVVIDGRVVRRDVTLGARDDALGVVAVSRGVNVGERVIVTPSAELVEGLRVTIGADADCPAVQSMPKPAAAPAKE